MRLRHLLAGLATGILVALSLATPARAAAPPQITVNGPAQIGVDPATGGQAIITKVQFKCPAGQNYQIFILATQGNQGNGGDGGAAFVPGLPDPKPCTGSTQIENVVSPTALGDIKPGWLNYLSVDITLNSLQSWYAEWISYDYAVHGPNGEPGVHVPSKDGKIEFVGPFKLGTAPATESYETGQTITSKVKFTCPKGELWSVGLHLIQQPNSVAYIGQNIPETNVVCTGGAQTLTLTLPVWFDPIEPGWMYGQASFTNLSGAGNFHDIEYQWKVLA